MRFGRYRFKRKPAAPDPDAGTITLTGKHIPDAGTITLTGKHIPDTLRRSLDWNTGRHGLAD